jgi:hypothetical protein
MKQFLVRFACLAALVPAASAISITVNDDYYLGSFAPAQPAGDAVERANTQNLIDLFNGSASYNPTLNSRTFTGTTDGSLIPTPAPGVPANGTQQAENGFTYSVNGAEYLLAKYSNDISHVWYVAGLTEVTIPSDIQGLSHVTRFEATTTTVPDGGATLALLGAGILALGVFRHPRNA